MPAPDTTALIVDDHTLIRTGLRRLIKDHAGISHVVEVSTGEEALTTVASNLPDLVVMDLSLPGISGTETLLKILASHPDTKIIVLTGSSDETIIEHLLLSGVLGYLTKGCSASEMELAITEVLAGRQYLSTDVAQRVALAALNQQDVIQETPASPFKELSKREMEITMLLLDGKRNSQIGESLFISEKTVSTHRSRAFGKLGIQSTVELARLAIMHGVWMEQPHS